MALRTKILIAVAVVLTTGVVGVATAAVTGNLDLGNLFEQEVVENDEEDDADNENEKKDAVIEETEEESAVEFDSYAEIVAFIQTDEYLVDFADYVEEAEDVLSGLLYPMILEADQSFDMTMLTEEEREYLNVSLLCNNNLRELIPVEGVDKWEYLYDKEVLNSYFKAFYENGRMPEISNTGFFIEENDYIRFGPGDAGEWIFHDRDHVQTYQYEEYLLIQAPCYYIEGDSAVETYKYTASALFKITEDELYPVQLVHVTTEREDFRGNN